MKQINFPPEWLAKISFNFDADERAAMIREAKRQAFIEFYKGVALDSLAAKAMLGGTAKTLEEMK